MLSLRTFVRRYLATLWPWFFFGCIALAFTNWLTLKIPQLAKTVVNQLGERSDLSHLENIALLIIALGLLQILIRSLSRILLFWPGRKMEANVRSDLFHKILHLPRAFFDRFETGDLISRLTNDVNHLRALVAFGTLMALNFIFLFIFIITQMVSIHPLLTAFCLLPLALTYIIVRIVMPRLLLYSKENQQAIGTLSNKVTEAFVNVHTIQANSATSTFVDRTEEANERVFLSYKKLLWIQTLVFPLITGLAGLAQLVVLFYGGSQVIAGMLSVGDILVFNVYIGYLAFPLTAIGIVLAIYQRARAALERLSAIDNESTEAALNGDSQPPPLASTDRPPLLEVRSLSFSFASNRPPVLSNLSFSLKEGTKLGVFGPIASGKSVLFHLITRLYDPPPQTIFLRGRDILSYSPATLREEIGYALQSPYLFSDSIERNIAFGYTPSQISGALGPRIREAADGAQMVSEIEKFDEGWETQIGEKGVRLSGGQKQRLALARLFLRKPPLLLLDDVLSSVDQRTEKRLVNYIASLSGSLVLSSHRVSALKSCDEIIILDAGCLVDRGPFPDVAKKHPELQRKDTRKEGS